MDHEKLENFIDECEDEVDEVIECIDFVYPISFSVFNSDFNIVDTVVIESDEAFYNFLDELEDDELFLNLASNEYFKAIDKKALKVPVITASFKDFKNGEYKTIMTFAKLARGYMTRYIIDTDANTIDDLKGFNYEGYGFSEEMSTDSELVFIR